MLNPTLMAQTDKYNIVPEDFGTSFEKYIFASIYNLYINGAETISPQDIDAYLSDKPNCYAIFEKEKGIAFLQDALDLAQVDNFDYYYNKFKKLKLIQDLKLMGYPTNTIYCENMLLDSAQAINEKFEELSIKDIIDHFTGKLSVLEEKYKVSQESKSYSIADGIGDLIENLNTTPDVGSPLQGNIFNTVVRGARKGKYYVRSMGTGVGKTRNMIGDVCYLSFPYAYNCAKGEWEVTGMSEKCLYFATEQELEEIQTMVLAYVADLDEDIILQGNYSDEIKTRLKIAAEVIEKYKDNLIVVHMPDPTIEQIRAKVKYHYFKDGIENLFYDYIFSSPGLLNEYRDLKIREDVILNILSTALKNLAVELKIFVMTATQLNDVSSEAGRKKEIKDQSLIRGSKAILDKADVGAIGATISQDELETLAPLIEKYKITPNQVTDVYKNRGSKYVKVRIWSYVDLGTLKKRDLFITNARYEEVPDFTVINYKFEYNNAAQYEPEARMYTKKLLEQTNNVKLTDDGEVVEPQSIDWSALF